MSFKERLTQMLGFISFSPTYALDSGGCEGGDWYDE
jgi:hypothetical protein